MMIRNYRPITAGLTLVLVSGAFSGPLSVAQAQGRTVRLDAGTVIPVKLDRELKSDTNQKGDHFTATLKVDNGNYVGLPPGTKVEGVINEARPKNGKDPGVIDLAFKRLRLPSGQTYAIDGSTIGLDNKSVDRTKDGRIVAKPAKKNNRLTYVGYGAGAGLLVSVLSGGRLHLENIALGGALGYLIGSLEKNKNQPRDVDLKPGTEIGVRLDKSVRYTPSAAYQDSGDRVTTTRYQTGEGNPLDRRRHDEDIPENVPDTTSDIGVLLDDQNVKFASTAPPVLVNGVVLVPIRPVLDAARISYSFANNNSVINAKGPDGPVRLTVGSRIAVGEGGARTRLDAEAQRLNGTIYVPIRFFDLVMGRKAKYDNDSKTVLLNTR